MYIVNKVMIYILFGPPGVGKTYIGELLSTKLGISFFDADTLLDIDARVKIRTGKFSQLDRNVFFQNLKEKVKLLLRKESNLIIAESFIKEVNRRDFIKTFSEIKFIFVHCSYNVAKSRVVERLIQENHIIDTACFECLWDEFDTPEIPHQMIDNSGINDTTLVKLFRRFNGEK